MSALIKGYVQFQRALGTLVYIFMFFFYFLFVYISYSPSWSYAVDDEWSPEVCAIHWQEFHARDLCTVRCLDEVLDSRVDCGTALKISPSPPVRFVNWLDFFWYHWSSLEFDFVVFPMRFLHKSHRWFVCKTLRLYDALVLIILLTLDLTKCQWNYAAVLTMRFHRSIFAKVYESSVPIRFESLHCKRE